MMENFNLKCEQLKTYICDGVNQVGLPPYAVELILESCYVMCRISARARYRKRWKRLRRLRQKRLKIRRPMQQRISRKKT